MTEENAAGAPQPEDTSTTANPADVETSRYSYKPSFLAKLDAKLTRGELPKKDVYVGMGMFGVGVPTVSQGSFWRAVRDEFKESELAAKLATWVGKIRRKSSQ